LEDDIQQVYLPDETSALIALRQAAHEGVARVFRLADGTLLAVVPIASASDVHLLVDAPVSIDPPDLTDVPARRHARAFDRDGRGRR
jgi:hypothetical protein